MARKQRWAIAGLALLGAVAAVGTWWCWDALALPSEPDELTLYSIDGTKDSRADPKKKLDATERLYFWPVLGKTKITDPTEKRRVINAVRRGMVFHKPMIADSCFWPRHALRVVDKGTTTDYLICFECRQIGIHAGDKAKFILTSGRPERTLDYMLVSAGVPLAPKSTE